MRKLKGFTLIELVIVIAVLGILAGVAIPRFLNASASARGAKVLANLRSIDSAVNLFMSKHGRIPTMAELTADGTGKMLDISTGYNEGMFLVKLNNGSEKEYTEAGNYGVSPEGRGYLAAAGHTVEYYLGGGATFGEQASVIMDALKNVGLNSLDSAAAKDPTTKAYKLVQDLKAQGIDLEAMGIRSWSFKLNKDSNNPTLFMTTVDISSYKAGDKVPIIQYRAATDHYTVWLGNIKTKNGNDGKPYNYIDGTSGSVLNPNAAVDQTFDRAQAIYNDYLAKHPV